MIARRDRLARAIDDAARLLDRVLPEVASRRWPLDLREQPLDLVDELLGLLSCFSNSSDRSIDQVVLGLLDHLRISSSVRPEVAVTVIDCSRPVSRSLALTADDAVGVDLEGDLDLDLALRRAAQAGEDELAEQLVLLGALALALQTRIFTDGLVVADRGEDRATRCVGTVVFCGMSSSK